MRYKLLLLATLSAFHLSAQEETTGEKQASLGTRISEVTVFADRAQVKRLVAMDLQKEIQQVTVKGLPAWIDTGSIRARIVPAKAGEVLNVQSKKVYLSQSKDEDIVAAKKRVQDLQDKRQTLSDDLEAQTARRAFVQEIRQLSSDKLPKEALTRDIPINYFKDLVAFTHDELRSIQETTRRLQTQLRDLEPELRSAQKTLDDLNRNGQLEQTEFTIMVRSLEKEMVTLEVEYQVPGASWEPSHEIRIGESNQIRLVTVANVRQTTGEDWNGARLRFSTRNPDQQTRIPQLDSLLLGNTTAANPITVVNGNASWQEAARNWDDNGIAFNRALQGKKFFGNDWSGNIRLQSQMSSRAKTRFAELADRGTTALYDAVGSFSVTSDGAPARIPIAAFGVQGTSRALAAPEVSENVARGIEVVNINDLPLLPGAAALFLEGAYVGDTFIDFVATGETFMLFAGTADDLIVTRKKNHTLSELKRLRKTNRMKIAFDISVQNTAEVTQIIRLADRVPVSDDQSIKVSYVRTTPEVTPNEEGLILWEAEIPARSSKQFTLHYQVEYPNTPLPRVAPASSDDPFGMRLDGVGGGGSATDSLLQIESLEKTFQ